MITNPEERSPSPVLASPAGGEEPSAGLAPSDGGRRPLVLCIDDDDDFRETLCEGLRDAGFDAVGVPDGPRGIDAYLDRGADLVVLDLSMPKMDGHTVCKALKELAGSVFLPVVFLTGSGDWNAKVRALEDGGDDFVKKPCSIDELALRLRVLVRIRRRALELENETRSFRKLALMDGLTSLGNRRAFDADLEREWARRERTQRPLSLLMIDIDHFKAFNDHFGHQTGDLVLRGVAAAIAVVVRAGDETYRFGGEEFAVLLPEADADAALAVAERIRRSVASKGASQLPVTVSIGVASVPAPGIASRDALVAAADEALYAAKAQGRDRVVAAPG